MKKSVNERQSAPSVLLSKRTPSFRLSKRTAFFRLSNRLAVRLSVRLSILSAFVLCALALCSLAPVTGGAQDERGIGVKVEDKTSPQEAKKPGGARPELVVQTGFGSIYGASKFVFSPDSRLLATASMGNSTVKLWEVSTGRELRSFTGKAMPMYSVPAIAFSPDSRLLAASGGESTVTVWEVADGRGARDERRRPQSRRPPARRRGHQDGERFQPDDADGGRDVGPLEARRDAEEDDGRPAEREDYIHGAGHALGRGERAAFGLALRPRQERRAGRLQRRRALARFEQHEQHHQNLGRGGAARGAHAQGAHGAGQLSGLQPRRASAGLGGRRRQHAPLGRSDRRVARHARLALRRRRLARRHARRPLRRLARRVGSNPLVLLAEHLRRGPRRDLLQRVLLPRPPRRPRLRQEAESPARHLAARPATATAHARRRGVGGGRGRHFALSQRPNQRRRRARRGEGRAPLPQRLARPRVARRRSGTGS